MLSILAEVCLESVVEAGRRQQAAPDDEGFERCGRSLQSAARSLRQTIAIKQRFDRGQARLADEARRRAETIRQDAERAHQKALSTKRTAVRTRIERLVWDEYEQDDALDLEDEVCDRLEILAEDPGFLDTPLEDLVQRLADDIGLYDKADDEPSPPQEPSPPCGERVGSGGVSAEPPEEHPHPQPLLARARGEEVPEPVTAVESDGSVTTAIDVEPMPPAPPPPPDPPPQPYIPPWEQLRPGQRMPGGGSGW